MLQLKRREEKRSVLLFLSNFSRSFLDNPIATSNLFIYVEDLKLQIKNAKISLDDMNKSLDEIDSLKSQISDLKSGLKAKKKKVQLPADVKPNGYSVEENTLLDVASIVLTGICQFLYFKNSKSIRI
jgi:hypothetical protein